MVPDAQRPDDRCRYARAVTVFCLTCLMAVWMMTVPAGETTDTVSGMERAELSIHGADRSRSLAVRIADEPAERAHGMQHLSPKTIRETPMWFVFTRRRSVGWHMHNVAIPLDIAFIDADGYVIGVQRMEPEGSSYGVEQPIRYALELAAGEARRLGIRVGARIERIDPDGAR